MTSRRCVVMETWGCWLSTMQPPHGDDATAVCKDLKQQTVFKTLDSVFTR